MVAKVKTSCKITDWRKYNESLVQRGSITFWFSDDVIDQWEHTNEEPKVGRLFVWFFGNGRAATGHRGQTA